MASFAVALVGSIMFVTWELKAEGPLFDLRVFRSSAVVTGAVCMSLVYVTFQGLQLLVPQYLRYVEDFTPLRTGVVMSVAGVIFFLLSPRSHLLVKRYGQRAVLVAALGFMAAGMAALAFLGPWGGLDNVLVGLCIYSVGFGIVVAPATAAIMVALPQEKARDGSAVNLVSRQVGGALGVALLGSLTSVVYRSHLSLTDLGLTPAQADRVEDSLSGALALGSTIDEARSKLLDAMADAAMVVGVQWALALAAALTLAGLVIAAMVLDPDEGRTPRPDAEDASG
jgi:predicted MFS family arabinose efflux permease